MSVWSWKKESKPLRSCFKLTTAMKWATAAQNKGMKKILNNELMITAFPRAVFDSRIIFCVSFFNFFGVFFGSAKSSVNSKLEDMVASGKSVLKVSFSYCWADVGSFFGSSTYKTRSWSICNFFTLGHQPNEISRMEVGTSINFISRISLFEVYAGERKKLKKSTTSERFQVAICGGYVLLYHYTYSL